MWGDGLAENRSQEINESEIIGSRMDMKDEKPILILDYQYVNNIEYVKVSYDGGVRNLLVHNRVYKYGESPYNQEIENVPYIVIKNDVYELTSFVTVGYRDGDYTTI